jgi:hypothetical protein
MPSFSAEKDDGDDVSDDESLSYGGRHLENSNKVEICHIPPGNPQNFKTITVSRNAAPALLNKGSLPGPCSKWCSSLCDDGDVCTIDNPLGYDCEVDGCLPLESRAGIDCDGGNECTVATCSSPSGCEYHSGNCFDSAYACDDNICDPLADEVCDGPCQYEVDAYECPSPGLPCDLMTGCYPSEVCGDVPGQVCEPSHGGCVGPTSCTFYGYGYCIDGGPNCATNIKSLAECEAAVDSLNARYSDESIPAHSSGILFISYSGLYHDPNWDGVSEYNEDGECYVFLFYFGPDTFSCSSLVGDIYEPGLDHGDNEDYDADRTMNCYSCNN